MGDLEQQIRQAERIIAETRTGGGDLPGDKYVSQRIQLAQWEGRLIWLRKQQGGAHDE